MDYETIIEVLVATVKEQKTTIFLKDYKIGELKKQLKEYEDGK